MGGTTDYDPLAQYYQPGAHEMMRAALKRPEGWLALLLIAAVFALFVRGLHFPLTLDDYNLLNEPYLKRFAAAPLDNLGVRWLPKLTLAWTYSLVGTDWFWYRVENLIIHAATVILLFAFLRRLLDAVLPEQEQSLSHPLLAFVGALAYAWHPVAVYGVAYLVERSIVMATFFGLAGLLCYLRALTSGKKAWFAGFFLFYVLALLSKEHSILLPGVAAALSVLLRKSSPTTDRKAWLIIAALVGVALMSVGSMVILQSMSVIGTAYEPTAFEIFSQMRKHGLGPNLDNAYPLSIVTQGHLFFQYLLLWIVPYTGWMSIDVRQPFAIGYLAWPQSVGFVAFLIYPAIAAKLLMDGGRKGLIGFGMLFPWILFLTELSTVRISEIFVLYRSYLWMGGVPVILVAALSGIKNRAVAIGIAVVVCLALFPLAWNRLGTFADEVGLWSDAIAHNEGKKNQGVERAYNKRGLAYLALNRYTEATRDFERAHAVHTSTPHFADVGDIGIAYFQFNHLVEVSKDRENIQNLTKLIEQGQGTGDVYLKRGLALMTMERPDLAAADFMRAGENHDLATEALRNLAKSHFQMGRLGEAYSDINRAIGIDPKSGQSYMIRGIMHIMRRDAKAALDDFDNAARFAPRDADVHYARGNLFVMLGRAAGALKSFDTAVAWNPRMAEVYVNRGSVYLQLNRIPEATADYNKAIEINPDQENAYLNRAKVYLLQSRKADAMEDFERVLNLNHTNGEALYNRALLLIEQNRLKEAAVSLTRACNARNQAGCEKLKEIHH